MKIRIIDIVYWLAIIVFDVIVYFILAILLMSYEDNYDVSKGEMWSWGSMNSNDKIIYVGFVFWCILNVLVLLLLLIKLYKKWQLKRS